MPPLRSSNLRRFPGRAAMAVAACVVALACIAAEGCVPDRSTAGDAIEIEGVVTARGNEPFSAYVLETSDGELYVLNIPDSLRVGFITPSRLNVTGRPYDGEWNGEEIRHIEVETWTEAE